MPDSRFVPLAPRRLQREHASSRAEIENPVPVGAADDQSCEVPQEPRSQQEPRPLQEPAVHLAPIVAAGQDRAEAESCDTNAAIIRATAIRIAAAACARALGYAVDRNPRLVARFVEEALRAAGSPHNAVVRVAQAVTTVGSEAREHDFVADPSLAPGDVFVDCAAGTIGATLRERADILVRAVAS
jgi:hypothetical protein